MQRTRRCFLASGCSPRRQQRKVAEGSPQGEPIGHALVAVRHKRRRRAVTYCRVRAPRPARPGRVPQCRPPMGLVSRDQGARRKSMLEHRRRRATQRSATTPIGPKGCGGMAPPSSLLLLDDGGTSPSSQRLESGPMAHATDDAGGHGRASGPKTPLGTAPRRPATKPGEICGLASSSLRIIGSILDQEAASPSLPTGYPPVRPAKGRTSNQGKVCLRCS